ncbi:MAG: hypothetical protein ACNI3H_12660 [Halarcobacter ebronensis]
MASDLSSFLKDELANTLEQLLSKSTTVDSVSALDVSGLDDPTNVLKYQLNLSFQLLVQIGNFIYLQSLRLSLSTLCLVEWVI